MIDFYFDFTSPYSYIAAEQIGPLAARHGCTVDWKPVLLGVLFKTSGGAPLTELHSWKAGYSVMDFERSARFAGLPYRHPDRFPQATYNAARAMLWIKANHPRQAVPFALEVFRTLFARGGEPNDAATLAGIARSLGLDAQAIVAATQDPAWKAALVRANEQAAAQQVFGAPMFVLDGERFWGSDRLAQLEARLRERAAAGDDTARGGAAGDDAARGGAARGGTTGFRALVDAAMRQVVTLDVDAARARLGEPGVQFVDLRDPRELEREGVIPGALHAPRGMLEFWVDPASPYYRSAFTPDKEYVFFCGGGWRSALACQTMQQMGFLPKVSHIEGGFSEWKKRGAPVEARAPKPSA